MIEKTKNLTEAMLVLPFLQSLDVYYPDFSYWYVNKVMPGLVLGQDVLLLAKQEGRVVGVALGKNSAREKKLRCVRVLPQAQHRGTGLRLIEAMFDELDTDKPHCTVAEEMLGLYSRAFVNRYGFRLNAVEKNLYRRARLEYLFND